LNHESKMKPSQALAAHRAEIIQIIEMNHAVNARVFGSVLHGDDTEDSDLDILVDPTTQTSLLDIARIKKRLQSVLGISVDVLTPKALPEKFRAQVLAEARPV
jgi:predicted nucleotidyltransferase